MAATATGTGTGTGVSVPPSLLTSWTSLSKQLGQEPNEDTHTQEIYQEAATRAVHKLIGKYTKTNEERQHTSALGGAQSQSQSQTQTQTWHPSVEDQVEPRGKYRSINRIRA